MKGVVFVLALFLPLATCEEDDRRLEPFGGLNVSQNFGAEIMESKACCLATLTSGCSLPKNFYRTLCVGEKYTVISCCNEREVCESFCDKAIPWLTKLHYTDWCLIDWMWTDSKLPCTVANNAKFGVAPCCVVSGCRRKQCQNAELQGEPNVTDSRTVDDTPCSLCEDASTTNCDEKKKDNVTFCTITGAGQQVPVSPRIARLAWPNVREVQRNKTLLCPSCSALIQTFAKLVADMGNATSTFDWVPSVLLNGASQANATRCVCTYATSQRGFSNSDLNETHRLLNEEGSHRKTLAKVMEIEWYVLVVSGAASTTCSAMVVILFFIEQRTTSYFEKCTFLLATTILLSHILGYAMVCVGRYLHHVDAVTLPVLNLLVLYGVQSFCCWTCVLSYDIWNALRAGYVHKGGRKRLAIYCTLSWGGAALEFAVAFVIFKASEAGRAAERSSWLPGFILSQPLKLVICLVPVLLFFVNVCLYLHTVFVIRKTESGSGVTSTLNRRRRSRLASFASLAFVMCLPGVLRIVIVFRATITGIQEDSIGMVVMRCIFCLCVAIGGMPGVYLFFAFNHYKRLYVIIVKLLRSATSLKQGLFTTVSIAESRAS